MPPARGRGGRGRGRGGSTGIGSHEQIGDPSGNAEELLRRRKNITHLKWKAYKAVLWALRMDHQKINWGVEIAIGEIKKALDVPQEEHHKIVQDIERQCRQDEAEADRRAVADTDDFVMETHEDEGEKPRCYNEDIVHKSAWIKWPADGKFKKVHILDYDIVNRAHEIFHVEEKLYEWLNLNELVPEDIQWKCPIEDDGKNEVSLETIHLYETDQLIKMVDGVLTEPGDPSLLNEASKYLEDQKNLVDIALETIARKIGQLTDKNEPEYEEGVRNDNHGDNQGCEDKEEKEGDDDRSDEEIEVDDNEGNDNDSNDSGGDSKSGDSESGDSSSDQSGSGDGFSSDSND